MVEESNDVTIAITEQIVAGLFLAYPYNCNYINSSYVSGAHGTVACK